MKRPEILDFDEISDWRPGLEKALQPYVSQQILDIMRVSAHLYIEEAIDLLFNITSRSEVIAATIDWIRSSTITGYHGSRLTPEDVYSVSTFGLLPLRADDRKTRLSRSLSKHANWLAVAGSLDSTILKYGKKGAAGQRENQVHCTLSKTGLAESYNHYLVYGSEFDQNVAYDLLGNEGTYLLTLDGNPCIVKILIPGSDALIAAHPHFSIDYMQQRCETPNVVREFLQAWSYSLAYPEFQSRSLKTDCGLVFHSTLPPEWIRSVEIDCR